MDKTPIIRSSQQFNKLLINLFFSSKNIIVKYKHFRYLSGRAVTNIVLSEVLDRTGEYHLDNTPNGCKIYKERIVEG